MKWDLYKISGFNCYFNYKILLKNLKLCHKINSLAYRAWLWSFLYMKNPLEWKTKWLFNKNDTIETQKVIEFDFQERRGRFEKRQFPGPREFWLRDNLLQRHRRFHRAVGAKHSPAGTYKLSLFYDSISRPSWINMFIFPSLDLVKAAV